MVDRSDQPGRSPSRSPNPQPSAPLAGARLHFNYSGKDKKIRSSRADTSQPQLPSSRRSQLPRQSTVDYTFSTASPITTSYDSHDTRNRSKTETSTTYEPPVPSIRPEVPRFYEQSHSSQYSTSPHVSSLYARDVPLATSSSSSSFLVPSHEKETKTSSPPINPSVSMSSPGRASYSYYDPIPKHIPNISPQIPAHSTHSSQKPPESHSNSYYTSPPRQTTNNDTSPQIPARSTSHNVAQQLPPSLSPRPHYRRETTAITDILPQASTYSTSHFPTSTSHLPPREQTVPAIQEVQTHQFSQERVTAAIPARNFYNTNPSRPPPVVRQSSTTTFESAPQSLNRHIGMSNPRSRTLNIGSSAQQRQEIEEAQRRYAADVARNEAIARERILAEEKTRQEARERMLAEEKARQEAAKRSEEARLLAIKRAEMNAKLEADKKKAELVAKLEAKKAAEDAKRKAEEAARRAEEARRRGSGGEADEEVERFIQSLEQRIKDSQDSKNLKGALAGRQTDQNHVKPVENPTNALKNEIDTKIENVGDQGATQSVADNSEEYRFLERLKNMKMDHNANRRKFAEHYYDFDDDDSDLNSLNSINSFLSTVTEEDDSSSLNFQNSGTESQIEKLPPSVITYIDEVVDGIFSSLEKTNFETNKNSQNTDFYANDANYNYQVISENAKQFFTPRNSTDKDNSDSITVKLYD